MCILIQIDEESWRELADPDSPGKWSLNEEMSVFDYVGHLSLSLCVCALVTFSLESGGNDRWIKFNANMTGLYRVHYDVDNWRALIAQLKLDHSVSNLNAGIDRFLSQLLFAVSY